MAWQERAAGRSAPFPAIVGFAVGCGLGALYEVAVGLQAFVPPAGLAALALAIGQSASPTGAR